MTNDEAVDAAHEIARQRTWPWVCPVRVDTQRDYIFSADGFSRSGRTPTPLAKTCASYSMLRPARWSAPIGCRVDELPYGFAGNSWITSMVPTSAS
jgi:hypothetical protein